MTRVTIMGSGSMGTAMAMVTADAGGEVVTWALEPEVADSITRLHENKVYQPGFELPPSITSTTDPEEALRDAEIVLLAIPSQTLRENLKAWKSFIPEGAILVSLMKGIELGTCLRMTQVIAEVAEVSPECQAPIWPERSSSASPLRPRLRARAPRMRRSWPSPSPRHTSGPMCTTMSSGFASAERPAAVTHCSCPVIQ